MKKQIDFNRKMEFRRKDIIMMYEYVINNNSNFTEELIKLTPEWLIDFLYYKELDYDRIIKFKEANKQKIKKILDNRSLLDTVVNYHLCLMGELIAEAFIRSLGYEVHRYSIDKDINSNNHTLDVKCDLIVIWDGKPHKIEVQITDFKFNNIKIKTYKLEENLKKDRDMGFIVLSTNVSHGLQYVTFYGVNALSKATIIKNDICLGGKDTYNYSLDNLKVKNIC